ncbi:MAG: AAA family ATPase [Isosphaeraceae bacterium]
MRLTRLQASNYRALAEVDLPLGPINVLFGPNGAGKSTLLDTIWFVRDCAIRSVGVASSDRDHGIGLLFDGAPEGSSIGVALSTDSVRYELTLQFSGGRIEPLAGERLASIPRGEILINRLPGTSRADLYSIGLGQSTNFDLREPERLSLNRYLDYTDCDEAAELDRILHFVRSYHSRSFNLYRLKRYGSESSYETTVWTFANNLWSVLRNLESKRRLDNRYETVMGYMRKAFPRTFEALVVEQTGPNSLYAKFLEKGRTQPILASGVSDGHIQLLILLTALFSEGSDRFSLLLIDEPEASLHPWALAVLAEAMIEAAQKWNKQILVATHSPVLISQFEPNYILSANISAGRSELIRLSEIPEIQDLLDRYAAGSLFMSEMIGGQSDGEVSHGVPREQKG